MHVMKSLVVICVVALLSWSCDRQDSQASDAEPDMASVDSEQDMAGADSEQMSDGSPADVSSDARSDGEPSDVGFAGTVDSTASDADAEMVAVCGNGILEPGEGCDDGNRVTETCPYDTGECTICADDCQPRDGTARYCGDGVTDEEEACDDGIENGSTLCSPSCALINCGDALDYQITVVHGWRLCIAGALERDEPELAERVMTALDADLGRVVEVLPEHATRFLRRVFIWVELDIPAFQGGVYHPSAGWLSDNGYPVEWAEGVQLGNARNYLSWTGQQPAMVLHELTHAWHHQHLGYRYAPILEAFDAAMEAGLYDRVPHVDGRSRAAYATTNHIEYFAELTEAWFWRNDFFPFLRQDLLMHDPQGAAMVEQGWSVVP